MGGTSGAEPGPERMSDRPRQLILAVVGLAGTGKSSVVQMLRDIMRAPVVYFGGVVVDEVKRRGLPVSEATERSVREELRAELGMSAIAQIAMPEIDRYLATGTDLVIDGLYSYAEYEVLDARYPGLINLIAVHARRPLREVRLAARADRPLTPSEIRSRDMREVRTLDKATAIALADWHLVNDSSLADLRARTEEIVAEIRLLSGA
jgi:dephospho-CoA kinase